MKKQFVKVLSLVMALMMVVGTFATVSFAADEEHVHTKGAKGTTVAPTCTEMGFTWYTCATCNDQFPDDPVQKLDHDFEVKTVAATCSEGSYTYDDCKNCNKDFKADTKAYVYPTADGKHGKDKLLHTFVVKTKQATCAAAGYNYYECTTCKKDAVAFTATVKAASEAIGEDLAPYARFNNIERLVHDYSFTITKEAKGCVDGTATGTCSKCNFSITVRLISKEHKYVYVDHTTYAHSCSEILLGYQCENCGDVLDPSEELYAADKGGLVVSNRTGGAANDWFWGKYEVKYNPDREDHNWVRYNGAITSKLEAMGVTTVAVAPTCGVAGYHTEQCTICENFRVVDDAALAHDFQIVMKNGDPAYTWGTTNTAKNGAYCVSATTLAYACANGCGNGYDKVIVPAVDHKFGTIVVDPTCTTDGYTITFCWNCLQFNDANVDKIATLLSNATTIADFMNTTTGAALVTGYWKQHNVKDALKHSYGAWSDLKGECTTGIYKERICSVCNTPEYDYKVAAGSTHTISAANVLVEVAATCTTKAYKAQYCTVEGCNYIKHDVKYDQYGQLLAAGVLGYGEVNKANHIVFVDDAAFAAAKKNVTKTPTCSATGAMSVICACNETITGIEIPVVDHVAHKSTVKTEDAATAVHESDPNVKYDNKGNVVIDMRARDPKCNAVGLTSGEFCTWCNKVLTAQKEVTFDQYNALVGDATLIGELNAHISNSANVVNVPAELAKYHVKGGQFWQIKTVASCVNDFVVEFAFPCCGIVEVLVAKRTDADKNNHVNKPVDAKAPTCETAGNHAHVVCADCGIVIDVDTENCTYSCSAQAHTDAENAMNPTIAALGHKWSDTKVDGKPETCTASGYTAYNVCENGCGAKLGYKQIPAHGDAHIQKISDKKPTCTASGIDLNPNHKSNFVKGGYYTASKGPSGTGWGDKDFKICTKCYDHVSSASCALPQCVEAGKCLGYKVEAIGHYYVTRPDNVSISSTNFANVYRFNDPTAATYDCTLPSLQVRACSICNARISTIYNYANTQHVFGNTYQEYAINKDGFITLNGVVVTSAKYPDGIPACAWVAPHANPDKTSPYAFTDVYKFYTCSTPNCGVVKITDQKSIPAHTYIGENGVKTAVSNKCTDIANYSGMLCADCGGTFGVTIKAIHNLRTTVKDPTCTEAGYTIIACVDCDHIESRASVQATGHTFEKRIDLVKPVGAKDGYEKNYCGVCKSEYTVVIKAPELTFGFTVDNKLVAGATVVNSGIVSLVIDTSAAKLNVNTIKLGIGYNPNVLSFVGADVLNTLFANRAYAGAATVTDSDGKKHETGTVSISVAAPNTADGKIQNVVLDGDNVGLMRLNFKILDLAITEGDANLDSGYKTTKFSLKSYEVADINGLIKDEEDNTFDVAFDHVMEDVTGLNLAADTATNYSALVLIGSAKDYTVDSLGNATTKLPAIATVKFSALGDVNKDGVVRGAKNATVEDSVALVKIWTNESELGKYSGAADIDKDGAITVADYELLMMYINNEISYKAFLNCGVEPAEEEGKFEITVDPNTGAIVIKPVA